jgi:hypothetical protein
MATASKAARLVGHAGTIRLTVVDAVRIALGEGR